MSNIILTQPELVELTNKVRHTAQARALRGLGIEFRLRGDGSLAVSRAHVEAVLGGAGSKKQTAKEPNWSNVK